MHRQVFDLRRLHKKLGSIVIFYSKAVSGRWQSFPLSVMSVLAILVIGSLIHFSRKQKNLSRAVIRPVEWKKPSQITKRKARGY